MKFIPHPYQDFAIWALQAMPAIGLLMEMGSGKTSIVLTAIETLKWTEYKVRRVLVIGPKRVVEDTWTREALKWDHTKDLTFSKVLGTEKQRIAALNANADIYLINREQVEWLVNHYKSKWPFDMVVIDELSSFKNRGAKRFRALKLVRPLITRIVGMTGTPAPNGLLDLWPQIYLLDEGAALGKTFTWYRDRYFEPDKRSRTQIFSYKPRANSEKDIYRQLANVVVSVKTQSSIKLPSRINNHILVKLSSGERRAYDQLERDCLLPFASGDIEAKSAAVLTNKLLQFSGGAVYDEFKAPIELHEKKLEALQEVIDENHGKPILVFYGFRHELSRLIKNFPQATELNSSDDIDRWIRGEIPILLAHPASAGHGLNLQDGGSTVVWFSLPWSLELYEQANARVHRQGQANTVYVHHIMLKDSIDQQVLEALSNKAITQDALVSALKTRVNQVLKKETV